MTNLVKVKWSSTEIERLGAICSELVSVLQQSLPSLERLALEEARANQAPTGLKKRTNAADLLKAAKSAIAKATK